MTTLEALRERIKAIPSTSEEAHYEQDQIWREVLTVIALGHPEARQLAEEALKIADLDFERWYA